MWDAFWSGGISNPLEVLEQITYLMFLRRLDDMDVYTDHTRHLRWSELTALAEPVRMLAVVRDEVFPWLRGLDGEDSPYALHMRDARFTIPTAGLLAKAVTMIGELPLADRDTKGDLYEYMLGRLATAGQNGQFRTPRHIIRLVVAMMAPGPDDDVCDPACGTAGFLVAAAEHMSGVKHMSDADHVSNANHMSGAKRTSGAEHRNGAGRLHGFDFDRTMLRIASMNMILHGVERPDIRYRDSLRETGEPGRYTMVLANPPFAGSVDVEATAADLRAVAATSKTELLFLALILRMLAPGGRAAVIVPDGVLFGSTRAHRELRRTLVEEHLLDAVVRLPGGVFKPYAGVSTAILFFTRTDCGGTDRVWFYEVTADGFSLDDRRAPVPAADDLPDVLARWPHRHGAERARSRADQSFCVPREEIAGQGYDLSLNRYRSVVHPTAEHRPPREILGDLEDLEDEIRRGLAELKAMLE